MTQVAPLLIFKLHNIIVVVLLKSSKPEACSHIKKREMDRQSTSQWEPTFKYDEGLPSLPVPPLQQTLNKYLDSGKPNTCSCRVRRGAMVAFIYSTCSCPPPPNLLKNCYHVVPIFGQPTTHIRAVHFPLYLGNEVPRYFHIWAESCPLMITLSFVNYFVSEITLYIHTQSC